MAHVSIVLFFSLLQLAVPVDVSLGKAKTSLNTGLVQHGDAYAAGHSLLQPCEHTTRPLSLWQRVVHPWTGDYQGKTDCKEVAVLHNTADQATCGIVLSFVILGTFFLVLFGICGLAFCGPLAALLPWVPVVISWAYVKNTGLYSDWAAGAISWSGRSGQPLKPDNISLQCMQLVPVTYQETGLAAFFSVYAFFMWFCFFRTFYRNAMAADTQVTKRLIPEEHRAYMESEEFKKKCIKTFKEADADHNGTLDWQELQTVALFDLTDTEKKHVQEASLFKAAFDACDADKSNTIDQAEFLELMKFIHAKAKYWSSTSSTEATEP